MLIPWAKGRCLTWGVSVPDTLSVSHSASTTCLPETAAENAATLKKEKYAALSQRHEFVSLAIETRGVYNSEGLEFVKEIGDRLFNMLLNDRKTACLFQRPISHNSKREQYLIFVIVWTMCQYVGACSQERILRAINNEFLSNINSFSLSVFVRFPFDFRCIY